MGFVVSDARIHPAPPYSAGFVNPSASLHPPTACGPVTLESAEGDRPMSIVWRLQTPLPARLFRAFSVLRGVWCWTLAAPH